MLAFKTLKGGGWMLLSRFAGRGIDFVALLVLARVLSPADFGLAALATSFVAVIDMIIELPVTQALVRLPHVDREHLDTSFTLGVLRGLLISIALVAAAWPYSYFIKDPSLMPLVIVLAIGPIFRSLSSPAMVHFNRGLRFRPVFFSEILGKIVGLCVALAAVSAGLNYWAIILNSVAVAIVTTIASYILAPYRPRLSLARFSDFAGFIGWYNSVQIIAALTWQFDRILIGTFSTKAALGQYTVADEMAIFPTKTLVGPTLQPVMAAFSQLRSDPSRLRAGFLKATRFVMVVSVPTCIGISLTADLVTNILLGAKWDEATFYLRVIALAMVPVPYAQTLSAACYAIDRPSALFSLGIIDMCLRVIYLPAGYYFASISGLSLARLLLSMTMFMFVLKQTKNLFHITVRDQCLNLSKSAIAAIAMSLAVLILRNTLADQTLGTLLELIVVSAIGAAVYLGTLWLLGMRLIIEMHRFELVDRWSWR